MSCLITGGIGLECRDNAGGIQNIYIGNYNGSSMTYTIGTSSDVGQITSFGGATVSMYTFNQPLESASLNMTGGFSTENGTSFYTQTVELVIHKMTAAHSTIVNTLGQGTWRIIVLDQNGRYFLVGAQNGARVSASTPGAGKALGDLNGYKLTFEAKEPLLPIEVTSTAALALITP